jgi:hypothetical protein
MLENNTSVLYMALADRVKLSSSAKALLLSIASDSQKHSKTLKGVGENVGKSKTKHKRSAKKLDDVFPLTYSIYKEIIKKEEITEEELPALAEKLAFLESILRAKYVFVQSQTMKLVAKEKSKLHSLDILRNIFTEIISDKERHQQLLGTVKELTEQKMEENAEATPLIDFLSPDALISPISQKA